MTTAEETGEYRYQWSGVKRDGTAATGVLTARHSDLAAVTQGRFASGWRSLTVTFEGAVVAAIERAADSPHERIWWAER